MSEMQALSFVALRLGKRKLLPKLKSHVLPPPLCILDWQIPYLNECTKRAASLDLSSLSTCQS